MNIRLIILIMLSIHFVACNPFKKINIQESVVVTPMIDPIEDSSYLAPPEMDSIFISDFIQDSLENKEKMAKDDKKREMELKQYKASATKLHDLVDTRLWLSFDYSKKHIFGKAILTLIPVGMPRRNVILDAKGFDIKSITDPHTNKSLPYLYDDNFLTIDLGVETPINKQCQIQIEYIAKPDNLEVKGSQAITSNKGLYFINSDGAEAKKPIQIWTQGETESNSKWMPTIDKPNQRCTQEINITVESKYKTLSNGLLTSSKGNKDGTRTDTWILNQPHAPYLFMMAIGEYNIIEDKWQGIPLQYYVEPAYKDDAKAIFNHIPEMLTFFSKIFGLNYPWPKYSQVVVRDYVSGAMENTTAVIFGEFVQKHKRELLSDDNDKIVAHEMSHHWFGDYVTTESWSNLTLNEGFANYSEYLWYEYKYGKDRANLHRLEELNGYLQTSENNSHDLINFNYSDKESMFDAHSYNKGGLVLHMLRNYLTDNVFFRGISNYLKQNAYAAVEAHHLRLALEKESGEDLNWFFNQWYYGSGYPILEIKDSFNTISNEVNVSVKQVQDGEGQQRIFKIPLDIDIYYQKGQKPERKRVWVDERNQEFSFKLYQKPANIIVDPENVICGKINHQKNKNNYLFEFYNNTSLLNRILAIDHLQSTLTKDVDNMFEDALRDSFYFIRIKAMNQIDLKEYPRYRPTVEKIAQFDKNPYSRATALELCAMSDSISNVNIYKNSINDTLAYPIVAAALTGLYSYDKNQALPYIEKLESETNSIIQSAISQIYIDSKSPKALSLLEKQMDQIDQFEAMNIIGSYGELLKENNTNTIKSGIQHLESVAFGAKTSPWKRFAIANVIVDLASFSTLNEIFTPSEKSQITTQAKNLLEKMKQTEQVEGLKPKLNELNID